MPGVLLYLHNLLKKPAPRREAKRLQGRIGSLLSGAFIIPDDCMAYCHAVIFVFLRCGGALDHFFKEECLSRCRSRHTRQKFEARK
nr:hypothetical protein [uncultured Oscillibacter sp.]